MKTLRILFTGHICSLGNVPENISIRLAVNFVKHGHLVMGLIPSDRAESYFISTNSPIRIEHLQK